MSNTITITLNDQEIQVSSGMTIREAAEANGIKIPTFCYDERLKPYTSCFLCVVEVEGAPRMLPACGTKVNPGMVIYTDSQKVVKTRKMALDLLLSDHVGDCIAPCEMTCPANVDIQGYIAQISNGNFEAAVKLIKEKNPLPVVCGRICPHPCESQCRRTLVDEAVAINPLKRFTAEYELEAGAALPDVKPETGKKVAIVGGGPAGLSAAWFLRQQGHAVDIYEALPELGGMTRYGIPRFRLPWAKLDAEIQAILDLGVNVHYNQRLGTDFTIESLKQNGADAVLLAIGAHKAKPMWLDNEDLPGVIGGVDFLRKVVLNEEVGPTGRVAVIGGGDTAMDCARVAKRLGAEVTLLYRRSQAEMPALPHEQDETMGEGIEFRFLTAPTAIVAEDGRATKLQVTTMELGEPDESGRRRPVPVEGSEEELPFDLIIAAIGQDPDLSCLDSEKEKPETTRWKTFVYDQNVMATTIEGVFTAGDCAFGPDTVIRAVGEGRHAAQAMDLYLSGAEVELKKPYAISKGRLEELDKADFQPRFVHKKRALEQTHEPEKRLADGGYGEINVGIEEAQALAETSRCIECGCVARFDCALRDYSTLYGADESKFSGNCRSYPVNNDHPLIRFEPEKCVSCGLCVRICGEFREISALAYVNRGFDVKVTPNFEDPLMETDCDACGMCVDLCPTGAIANNTDKEYGPWESDTTITSCTSCPKGCALKVYVRDGLIINIGSVDGDPVNGAAICKDGRFSYQMRHNIYRHDFTELSERVDDAKAMLKNSDNVAVIVSANLPVETHFAAAKIAKHYGGKLYYLPGEAKEQSKFPYAKIEGKANVSLLKQLGGVAWSEENVTDLLLLIGVDTPFGLPETTKEITLNNFEQRGQVHFPLTDSLREEGAFLTEKGQLALLKTEIPVNPEENARTILCSLINEELPSDLDSIRNEMVQQVPELKNLTGSLEGRLVDTDLAPIMENVASDSREKGFQEHVRTLFQK